MLAALGHALMLGWRHDESRELCEQALELAQRSAHDGRSSGRWGSSGSTSPTSAAPRRGSAACGRRSGWPRTAASPRTWAGVHLAHRRAHHAGRPRESVQVAAAGIALAREHGREHGLLLSSTTAEALFDLGEWDEADRVGAAAIRAGDRHLAEPAARQPGRAQHRPRRLRPGREPGGRARDHARGQARLAVLRHRPRRARPLGTTVDDADAAVARACGAGRPRMPRCFGSSSAPRAARPGRAGGAGPRPRRRRRAPRTARAGAQLLTAARQAAEEAAAVTPNAGGWRAVAEAEHDRAQAHPKPAAW